MTIIYVKNQLLLILGITTKPSTRAMTINKTMPMIPRVSCSLVTPPSLTSFNIRFLFF